MKTSARDWFFALLPWFANAIYLIGSGGSLYFAHDAQAQLLLGFIFLAVVGLLLVALVGLVMLVVRRHSSLAIINGVGLGAALVLVLYF